MPSGAAVIDYTDSLDGIESRQLEGFFAGWPYPPSPETHLRLLHSSDYVVLAIEVENGQVVGFVTALTDGVLSGFISAGGASQLSGARHWSGVDDPYA